MNKFLSQKLFSSFQLFTGLFLLIAKPICAVTLPVPDHIVICILENHGYSQIIGSTAAPYINSLASAGASFGASYALTHPSQPNYIMLFSGSNQGVTTDNTATNTPWSTLNLGSSLINSGHTFTAYSQSLPSVGSTVTTSGAYARKHAPWVNWQGTGTNRIPAISNQPFTSFPTNFSTLPTVSFVIPDMNHDMHNGTDPSRITTADTWVQINLNSYITWANTHNSLFILTFDENDNSSGNQIATIFTGQMVQPGYYNTITYNHYNILRTVENMYGLPYAGASSAVQTILECWINTSGIMEPDASIKFSVDPNPVSTTASFHSSGIINFSNARFLVYDILGNVARDLSKEFDEQKGNMLFNREGLKSGIYFYRLTDGNELFFTGKMVIE